VFTDRLVQGKPAIGDARGSAKSKVLECKLDSSIPEWTTTFNSSPSVSTTMCRLRPVPCGSSVGLPLWMARPSLL
jgi:hypothetical protein